jgi:hypothetical protein
MTSARWLHQTPPRFRDARPDMIPDDMRVPWLAHQGNVIVFGATGTGKTFATYALLGRERPAGQVVDGHNDRRRGRTFP